MPRAQPIYADPQRATAWAAHCAMAPRAYASAAESLALTPLKLHPQFRAQCLPSSLRARR